MSLTSRDAQGFPRHLFRAIEEETCRFLVRLSAETCTAEERLTLHELRTMHCNTAYNAESLCADRLLREIWNAAFPDEPVERVEQGEHWKRFGFQSTIPHTDIRAGIFGLEQLHYMACNHTQLIQRLSHEARELGYPFACSCLNLSHMLVLFFDLLEKPAMSPVRGAKPANQIQLKNFSRLCLLSHNGPRGVLDELFCALAKSLHETWVCMCAKGDCTVMDFPLALSKVYDFNAAFWETPHDHVSSFIDVQGHVSASQANSANSYAGFIDMFQALCKGLRQTLNVHVTRLREVVSSTICDVLSHPQPSSSLADCLEPYDRIGSYEAPNILALSAHYSSTCGASVSHATLRAKSISGDDLEQFFATLDTSPGHGPSKRSLHLEAHGLQKTSRLDLDAFLDHCLDSNMVTQPSKLELQCASGTQVWESFGDW